MPEKSIAISAKDIADLDAFSQRLEDTFNNEVSKLSPIRERMYDDTRQVEGFYPYDIEAALEKTGGKDVFANITRNKARAAEARIGDLLLPNDGSRNFAVKPTPIADLGRIKDITEEFKEFLPDKEELATERGEVEAPDLPQQGQTPQAQPGQPPQEQGQPPQAQEIGMIEAEPNELMELRKQELDKIAVRQIASKKAENMETLIWDQMVEANYETVAREIIRDAVRVGTGIVEGPVTIARIRSKWEQTTLEDAEASDGEVDEGEFVLKVVEDITPSLKRISPFDYVPDSSALKKGEENYEFKREFVNKKQLSEFKRYPNVIESQIDKALQETPEKVSVSTYREDLRNLAGTAGSEDNDRYELITYYGPITKDQLRISQFTNTLSMEHQESLESDPQDEFPGIVWFVNGYVIKAVINPLENSSPFKVFNWEKSDGSIFGYGIPYILRSTQRVINSAYRMMVDNGGVTAGPQVIINKDLVSPADGDYTIKALKLWLFEGEMNDDVRNAFNIVNITNNQQELLNLLQVAKSFADEETNLPTQAQGENSPNAQDTATASLLSLQTSNMVLRSAAKNFDDGITKPLITDYYQYNMLYSDDNSIKGDFSVRPLASTALVNKQIEKESAGIVLQTALSSPELAAQTDINKLYKKWLNALSVPSEDVMKPPEQVAQEQANAQPPIDPIEQGKLQLQQQELALKQQEQQFDQEYKILKLQSDERMKEKELQIQAAKAVALEGIEANKFMIELEKVSQGSTEKGLKAAAALDDQINKQSNTEVEQLFTNKKLNIEERNVKVKEKNEEKGFDSA